MRDFTDAYMKLETNLTDSIAEEQAKLGYRKESIRLYYPLDSLNHFFECQGSVDDMVDSLQGFSDYVSERLGVVEISHKGKRFCFCLSPQATEYVYNNKSDNGFIYELVDVVQDKSTNLDTITALFKKWDDGCTVEKIDNGEFDLMIKFNNYDDPYFYCFKDEGCHVIYHRFLPEDYRDLL